ncbi:MAG: ABC transporter substrate-binding protein [Clostridiales Family XIII bacterium]|jgi:branched-chain amino acid transport system substrate-binding protein|nr:ABC transporter substrate-binding protein [Clostridiales Family XIII bacterium]
MKAKRLLLVLMTLVLCVALFGCNGSGSGTDSGSDSGGAAGEAPEFIKIGVPNPNTGPIASFGIGTPWAEQTAVDVVNADGGIYIAEYDKKIPVKLFVVDTESNPTKASEVTQQLIEQNEVDLLVARHTPDTALPVSAMAERYGVPCVSLECPIEPWLAGGPYEWVYHSFWSVDTVFDMYYDMWQELGYGEGTVIGFMFPNDPDGLAWYDVFIKKCAEVGFVVSDPGNYPIGQQDWTSVISKFKADGIQLLTGCEIAPDFAGFAAQAAQQGLTYELATFGRAFLFPADANANPPSVADGLTCELWWSPWHPFASSLTGMTTQEMCDLYEAEFNVGWSPPMGYKYAALEIAIDALTRAASLDPAAIRDAIGATNLDTIIGHIEYDPATHVAPTPIVGGQWKLNAAGDAVEIKVVYSDNHPEIPENATLALPPR